MHLKQPHPSKINHNGRAIFNQPTKEYKEECKYVIKTRKSKIIVNKTVRRGIYFSKEVNLKSN